MAEPDNAMEVANEQVSNAQYVEILKQKSELLPNVAMAMNEVWTGTRVRGVQPILGGLAARIKLDRVVDIIDSDEFYIGPWYVNRDGLLVYSWADQVKNAMYGIGDSKFFDATVTTRRSIITAGPKNYEVLAIDDEWPTGEIQSPAFPARRRLSIPAPPEPSIQAPIQTLPSEKIEAQVATHAVKASVGESPAPAKEPIKADKPKAAPPVRAMEVVRQVLAAPRKKQLSSLLATLQPDQFDLISRPLDEFLAIQGHPGTGKTVIAAHRAAYLVHPDVTKGARPPRILVVGPTMSYAQHIAGVLESLTQANAPISTWGLGNMLVDLTGFISAKDLKGKVDGPYFEVSADLERMAEAAAHDLRVRGEIHSQRSQEAATRLVYELIRRNGGEGSPLTDDWDLAKQLAKLPDWSEAKQKLRLLPLLAQCRVSAVEPFGYSFDHIIVDEAQDVRPLEWTILKKLNPRASWTLLGDMNQRRTDWSYASWSMIARELDIIDDGEKFEPVVCTRGYRSTAVIMRFASQLLPKEERKLDHVQQEGAPILFRKTSEKTIIATAIDCALTLRAKYNEGTTAIISDMSKELRAELQRSGWATDSADRRLLTRNDDSIFVLTPGQARGLEYDAVVVIEPADFPPNLGRQGSLFTSLTRANKELALVYAKPLPQNLKKV